MLSYSILKTTDTTLFRLYRSDQYVVTYKIYIGLTKFLGILLFKCIFQKQQLIFTFVFICLFQNNINKIFSQAEIEKLFTLKKQIEFLNFKIKKYKQFITCPAKIM